jgi:TatA/E family protein of Tat protein translocase
VFGLSFAEIAVILALALVVLGPKRLPEIARSIGRGLREIRRASDEVRDVWEDVEAPTRRRGPRSPPDRQQRLPAPGPAPGTVSAASRPQVDAEPGAPAHAVEAPASPESTSEESTSSPAVQTPSDEGGSGRGDA